MTIYLGLGCNLGDRVGQLESAVSALKREGFEVSRISPVVESPAMLPRGAEAGWNRPYLNVVLACDARWAPREAMERTRSIELELGREPGPRWSPRSMDIDLLLWHDEQIEEPDLVIPHRGLADRDFVITPLMHLAPNLKVPGLGRSVFEISLGRRNIPLWMGILNITPDSFSDGGSWCDSGELATWVDRMISENVQIIDVGAESTRPNAKGISADEEWRRLDPVLRMVRERIGDRRVRPYISLDSRHPQVVEKALNLGIDMINDVTGLADPGMVSLVRDSGLDAVAMHAMSVPVDPAMLLPGDRPATAQLTEWLGQRLALWDSMGLNTERIIFDPGIGFGKTSIQAGDILSGIAGLRAAGLSGPCRPFAQIVHGRIHRSTRRSARY